MEIDFSKLKQSKNWNKFKADVKKLIDENFIPVKYEDIKSECQIMTYNVLSEETVDWNPKYPTVFQFTSKEYFTEEYNESISGDSESEALSYLMYEIRIGMMKHKDKHLLFLPKPDVTTEHDWINKRITDYYNDEMFTKHYLDEEFYVKFWMPLFVEGLFLMKLKDYFTMDEIKQSITNDFVDKSGEEIINICGFEKKLGEFEKILELKQWITFNFEKLTKDDILQMFYDEGYQLTDLIEKVVMNLTDDEISDITKEARDSDLNPQYTVCKEVIKRKKELKIYR